MTYLYETRQGQRREIARSVYLTLLTMDLVEFVLRDVHVEVIKARSK